MRGYVESGVLTFKGIPYGQDTAGENRWLPAKPPKPWDGEYPALVYGANCPQRLHNFTAIEQSFLFDWTDGYMSEDMLKLNVWTPSLSAVMCLKVSRLFGSTPEFWMRLQSAYDLSRALAEHGPAIERDVRPRENVAA